MNCRWTSVTLHRRRGSRLPPGKRNAKKQNGCLRRPYKYLWNEERCKAKEKRYTHLNPEFQRTARIDKKAFLSDQCKEIEENNRMGKTRDLIKKIRNTKIMASGPITTWQMDGKTMKTVRNFIFGDSKSLQMVITAMKLKDTCSLE